MSTPRPSPSRPVDPAAVVLILRPEPNGPDHLGRTPDVRLRGALKLLLRGFGWRCTRAEPADPHSADTPAKAPGQHANTIRKEAP